MTNQRQRPEDYSRVEFMATFDKAVEISLLQNNFIREQTVGLKSPPKSRTSYPEA